jgi:hypothetical protein
MKETTTSCTVADARSNCYHYVRSNNYSSRTSGNNQNTGLSMFFSEKLFMLFLISDVLSLLSASISLLMFISILTAHYADEDFLKSLLNKMIIGLFHPYLLHSNHDDNPCASLFIILLGKSRMVIPLVFLSGVVVVVFTWMQFGLLIDMVNSTYKPEILDMKVKPES